MTLSHWFKGSTPLQLAIERGLKPGGDLVAELKALDDVVIKSEGDAKAICQALQAEDNGELKHRKNGDSPLYALARLFQDVEPKSEGCDYLRENGVPLLIKLARKALLDPGFDSSNLLFVLKMLAGYGTEEGTDLVIELALRGYAENKFLWSVVLAMYSKGHPETHRLFAALSDPLPDNFLAISLLDAANRFFLEGGEGHHPFDSDEGVEKLKGWLEGSDPEYFSYATSATAALPFIQHPRLDELFQAAFGHPDADVQLEAAWAATKLDRPGGLQKLVELCRNVNLSAQAQIYLKELNREDAVPPETKQPDFRAKAEFVHWLSHPNELGRRPDELEVIDHRDLRWPGSQEPQHFWLIRFRAHDETGLQADQEDAGIVVLGRSVWCHFSYDFLQRPPEDAYAIHCYWEMTGDKLITDNEVDQGSAEYDSLLHEWPGTPLRDAKLGHIAELSPQINYPRRLVGVASAVLDGAKGWAVLDGPDSRWYAEAELPDGETARTVLKLHIGRRLLGFMAEPDRKRFLRAPETLPPGQIKRVYEKLVAEAETGTASRRKELIGNHGLLSSHFDAYLNARGALREGSRNALLVETYERILRIARQHPEEAADLLDSWAALGKNFEEYVNALVEVSRQPEIVPLVELFRPHWQHNLGYGLLGRAAFKAGPDDIAEPFFLKLKEEMENWQRGEGMSHLATIWHRQGKGAEARVLLVECLRKVLEESRTAHGADIKFFEEHYQTHRSTFAQLFPGEPLADHLLPESTLRNALI